MTKSMKAIVCRKFGSADVLKLEELPIPAPGPDEVLIKVKYASVNSWDWDWIRGKPFIVRLFTSPFRPLHKILGADISGTVESIGTNVISLKPGDAIMGDISGCHWGGFAEYVTASETALIQKPENLSFAEAAAIPQAGILAWQGLHQYGPIQPGQKVLINGSGGGVGSFAIQLAKMFGAEVTAVDSADKFEFMRKLGANYLIDYNKNDYTKSGKLYDLILDVNANRPLSQYKKCLNPGAGFVIVGGSMKTILRTALSGMFSKKNNNKKLSLLIHKPNQIDLQALSSLCAEGKIKVMIDKEFHSVKLLMRFSFWEMEK
ncbi:MAG: NAD(P)-dependent alcohol dehydrogenase [Saprospiraceae bacterium]|nr:NAD(P)-dependent alcohol dehydrogenase [Saprospiraceae bacterium]